MSMMWARSLDKRVEGWGKMVKRAPRFYEKEMKSARRMEVVGEEGISLEDMIIYLKVRTV